MLELITKDAKATAPEVTETLDELARVGARRMIVEALQLEVDEHLHRMRHLRDERAHALVVRNGKARERTVTLGAGVVKIRAPRVHDRRAEHRFSSRILPPYMRRSPRLEEALPVLYLRGLSTGDFSEALPVLLGPEAAGLSPTTISRLIRIWQDEYRAWRKRSLVGKDDVYIWADGVYFRVRLEEDRLACLVIIGVLADGTKEVIALDDGYRESQESSSHLNRGNTTITSAKTTGGQTHDLRAALDNSCSAMNRLKRLRVHARLASLPARKSLKRLVLGITGASGVIYGIRLLEALSHSDGASTLRGDSAPAVETHVVLTPAARITIAQETDWKVSDVEALATVHYDNGDIGAAIASGSFPTFAMLIVPCTIKTLSAVANSYSGNLLSRAADVTLKEGRPLLLAVRETPLHPGHISLMGQAASLGAVIFPPMPAFYGRPQSLDDVIDGIVGRILFRIGIDNKLYTRWRGTGRASSTGQEPADGGKNP